MCLIYTPARRDSELSETDFLSPQKAIGATNCLATVVAPTRVGSEPAFQARCLCITSRCRSRPAS
jgi:hypothetical protein